MKSICKTAKWSLAALGLLVATQAAAANEIALTFHDGTVTIRGEFMGFNNNAYLVKTKAGEINIPASYVTCEGVDCITILASAQ